MNIKNNFFLLINYLMIINTFAQIKIMNKKEYVLFGMLLFLTSCVSKKDIYYFQDIEASQYENSFKFLDIQPGDILDIQIKALNLESVKIFQKPSSFLPQQQIQNRAVDGYLVGDSGTINLPILGEIDTSNHNTQSLALSIQAALTTYIKDPTVNVRLLNFRVSVLGEVRQPGTYTFYEERISLPQVLGAAGDLTINADRNHVLMIRNIGGEKIHRVFDLTKSKILGSPYYFLNQNDVIYVRPNNAQVKSSGLVGNASTLVSILSLAVSLFIVITR